MTLFYCTTDQVRVSSICIYFCGSYAPFGTTNTENTQFSALFSYMLWHIELTFFIWLCFTVLQIKFECRQFLWELCPVGNLEYWKYIVFRTFSYMLWHIELHFYISLCFTVLQIKFECRQLQLISMEVMPLWNLEYWKYVLWHIELKFFIRICLMYCRSSSNVITFFRRGFRLSINFLHISLTCIGKFHWNLKFDVGYF